MMIKENNIHNSQIHEAIRYSPECKLPPYSLLKYVNDLNNAVTLENNVQASEEPWFSTYDIAMTYITERYVKLVDLVAHGSTFKRYCNGYSPEKPVNGFADGIFALVIR